MYGTLDYYRPDYRLIQFIETLLADYKAGTITTKTLVFRLKGAVGYLEVEDKLESGKL